MSRTATVFFALLAAGLLGFILFLQPALRTTRDTPSVGGYVLRFETGDVQSIALERADGEVQFDRVPNGWEMDTEPRDRVGAGRLEALLTSVQNLRVRDILSAGEIRSAAEALDLGFDPPRLTLRLDGAKKGGLPLVLHFGREGTGEGEVYVRTDRSEETYLVSAELLELADRPVDDWRDPRLVPLPVDQIERIRVRRAGGEVELVRQGTRWRLIRPLQGRADSARLEEALELILGARVFAFSTTGESNGETGVEILLWPEGEDQPVVLRLGEALPEERLKVWQSARRIQAEVARENFALAEWKLENFRSPKILEVNPDLIDRLAVRVGSETVELRRDEEDWTDAGETLTLPTARINPLLELLESEESGVRPLFGTLPEEWDATPVVEVHLNSWLSENTPEALAGLYPLEVVRVWQQPASADHAARFWLKTESEPGYLEISPEWVENITAWLQSLPGGKPDS